MHPRKSAAWQNAQDDRILEYLAQEGCGTPELIARESTIDVSEGFIEDRLHFLGYAGLVDRIHGDMYEITGWGDIYLNSELDAHHQPVPTVSRAISDS